MLVLENAGDPALLQFLEDVCHFKRFFCSNRAFDLFWGVNHVAPRHSKALCGDGELSGETGQHGEVELVEPTPPPHPSPTPTPTTSGGWSGKSLSLALK